MLIPSAGNQSIFIYAPILNPFAFKFNREASDSESVRIRAESTRDIMIALRLVTSVRLETSSFLH